MYAIVFSLYSKRVLTKPNFNNLVIVNTTTVVTT